MSEIKKKAELRNKKNTFSTYKPAFNVYSNLRYGKFACFCCTLIYTPVRNVNCKYYSSRASQTMQLKGNRKKKICFDFFSENKKVLRLHLIHRAVPTVFENLLCKYIVWEQVGLSRLTRLFEINVNLAICNPQKKNYCDLSCGENFFPAFYVRR